MKSIGKGIKYLKAVECNNELGLQDEDVKIYATQAGIGNLGCLLQNKKIGQGIKFLLIYKRKFDL